MENKKWYEGAVMVNRDPNWMYRANPASKEACQADFEEFFSKFEGKITDVLLGVLEQTTTMPSKYLTWRGEKYLQKNENGHEVDYPNLEGVYKSYAEYGVDGVQIFIDKMHELGIRPWITLRMNDVHFGADETSFLRSDLYYEAKAAGEMIGGVYGYYASAINFKKSVRYREALLGFIGEILNKYDIFGLELDFMRDIYCFDYLGDGEGIQEIMLDFIREVKRMIAAIEKRVGHDIKLSIRTCRDPEDAYIFGFDIKTMVDEGLVDVVVPTGRWGSTDSAIPIRKWKELLSDKAALMGGIETLCGSPAVHAHTTPENSKAYAAAYMAQGADGIYFNNHENYTERNRASWETSFDTCLLGRRDFVVTYQDIAAYNSTEYKPLPHKIIGNAAFPLEIGKVKPTDKITLLIDHESDTLPTAYINGVQSEGKIVDPVELPSSGGKTVVATTHTPIEYEFTGIETESKIVLYFRGKGYIHYIRLSIDAQ